MTEPDTTRAGSDAGFSLIETTVALVLMASLLALLGSGTARGWRGIAQAEHERRALALAEAEIQRIGREVPLATGTREERRDGYAARIEVRPHAGPVAALAREGPALYWVTIDVSWHQGLLSPARSVRLTTLKMADPP